MSPAELCLERMTSPEVAAALARGMRTVVLPFGAIEQHGPHLPLSVDADHADRLALLIATRVGDALVAPTVRVGCSSHHMAFAGTISLEPATFEAVCRDCCVSLAHHGFTRILVISGHFGNFPVLKEALPRIRAAVAGRAAVDAFTDARAMLDTWQGAVASAGGKREHVGGHADVAETSIMLALRRDGVRMAQAQAGRVGILDDDELARMWKNGLHEVSAIGVLGDPREATPEIGEHCLAAVADLIARAFASAPGA